MRTLLLSLSALVAFGCATTGAAGSSGGGSPELDELRALDKQQDYRELVTRLKSVPPTKRDAEWEGLVAKGHIEVLKAFEVKNASDGERALAILEDQATEYPTLKKNADWLTARADLGVKAFGWTFSNYRHAISEEKWVPQVKAFVEKDTVTKGLALRAAKDVVLQRLVASSAWPLFELAFTRDGDAVCADEKLPEVVIDLIDARVWLDEMKVLVTKRCVKQLKAPVVAKLAKDDSGTFRKAACQMLKGEPDVGDALKVCLD